MRDANRSQRNKSMFIEKRRNEANSVLAKKQKAWTKEKELRQELQKLKQEDNYTKVER